MKAIQITIDERLLKQLDADAEVRKRGRSEFIRKAVEAQLKRKREGEIRTAYGRGYREQPVTDGEFAVDAEALAWPDE